VATVSGGKVTTKGAGTATITAKTVNGKTATCKVTVTQQGSQPSPTYVSLRIWHNRAIYNGKQTTIDNVGTRPFKIDGRAMLPIRFVSEKMGAKVTYKDDKTPIKIVYGAKTVTFLLGGKTMTVTENGNSKTVTLDVVAQKRDGKTFIPLRAIGEALGFDVYYEAKEEYILVANPKMDAATRNARLEEARKYII